MVLWEATGVLCPFARNVIQVTLMSSSFKSSCVALNMQRQTVPIFITDVLLEGNMANILGDGGDAVDSAGSCCGLGTSFRCLVSVSHNLVLDLLFMHD